ncbi:MAG: EamA/RhaT family transporter, partial [Roseiflexaceae bacterium]|nr:EamA/RhaT family transporter [Roseiflexaceae bacterium]
MGAGVLAVVYGLLSAATWGGGDFAGGLAARRAAVPWVLLIGQLCGLMLLVLLALLRGEPALTLSAIGWAAAAGAFGSLGLAMLYSGLATGRAALVAPTSAVISASLPVLYTAYSAGLPGPLKLLGFALAL